MFKNLTLQGWVEASTSVKMWYLNMLHFIYGDVSLTIGVKRLLRAWGDFREIRVRKKLCISHVCETCMCDSLCLCYISFFCLSCDSSVNSDWLLLSADCTFIFPYWHINHKASNYNVINVPFFYFGLDSFVIHSFYYIRTKQTCLA